MRLSVGNSMAGVVVKTGSSVTSCSVGDRVAGILPLDSEFSVCSQQCTINEFDIVKMPEGVDFEMGAACVGDGVRAYVALLYLGRVAAGDTVLLMNAATAFGCMAIQLAHTWGAKVLAVVTNGEDKSYLQKLHQPPDHIIELDRKTSSSILCSSVMEETGRLGVNVIIDNGVKLFTSETEQEKSLGNFGVVPHKHEIISCLGIGARWVTTHPQLQLDPPDAMQLHLRCASLGFLFEHAWNLSSTHQGRWLHMMQDVLKHAADGSIKPYISQVIPFSTVTEFLSNSSDRLQYGKVIVRVPAAR